MSRTGARDVGFKLVFQYLFSKDFDLEDFLKECEIDDSEKEYSLSVLNAVKNNIDVLNEKLNNSLKNDLKLNDLYTLDHAILLVSMAQIDYLQEPKGIVINEAVRTAKKYSTDRSPSFINGVLSSIYN